MVSVELSYYYGYESEQFSFYRIPKLLFTDSRFANLSPSLGQAKRLKELSEEGKLDANAMEVLLREDKSLARKVTLKNDRLQKYFPPSYTPKQMEEVIIRLLEQWQRRKLRDQER